MAAHVPGRSDGPEHTGYEVLADRADATVVRCRDLVVKAHAGDTDRPALAVRLRIAADPALAPVLLAPVRPAAGEVRGRPVSLWPYGAPVDPERPEDAPWEEAARLLAALHRTPVAALPGPLPPMRGPAKVARALRRMTRAAGPAGPYGHPYPEAEQVRAAAARLPGWARGAEPAPAAGALCHGDLHLGQLVRHPAPGGPWRLIDVDDLGLGDPAWDLARPAAWYAAGLLDPGAWLRFLEAYRAAGGPAAGPADADPWPRLDLAARALTVQSAALAVAKAAEAGRRLDGVDRALTDACARISVLPPDGGPAGTP
ncbi:phosphotransferase family protein [Streptomyces antimicrobicus]|uniref:Aminoglycoside phosphotransferase family protein n=1 Tax=Streptomyces antimicrobicus TaxID=2883108 RepID=A0ABS8BE12_9ACTN|nr:aminoglycoside phosphotransferase family protein [Streptomyces antimicrobicus]MCB5182746.1 aminoglycoside phosphotransferase family protein [Streptomyces antimicrobicus]